MGSMTAALLSLAAFIAGNVSMYLFMRGDLRHLTENYRTLWHEKEHWRLNYRAAAGLDEEIEINLDTDENRVDNYGQ